MASAKAAGKPVAPQRVTGRTQRVTGRGGALAAATVRIDFGDTLVADEFPSPATSKSPWRRQLDEVYANFIAADEPPFGEYVRIGRFANRTSAGKQERRFKQQADRLVPAIDDGLAWSFKTLLSGTTSELWVAIVPADDDDMAGAR